MKREIVHFACAALCALGAVSSTAALASASALAPAQPGSARQNPAPQSEREKQQKEAERKEAERKEAERKEAERKRAARERELAEQQEAERRKAARERAAGEAPPGQARSEGVRETQQALFQLERQHRSIIARLDRLHDVYSEAGNERKVALVEELRQKHHRRYERFLQIYRERMGADEFAKVDPALRMGRERRMANARVNAKNNENAADGRRNP
jgi:colicin import membrane protein